MIRVYLDWNIFSYLKSFRHDKEPFIALNDNLIKNKSKILIPYTSAHLTDLITSYKKSEEGRKQTIDDLNYLEELTNNSCILYDYQNKSTYCETYNIQDYFKQLLENENVYDADLEALLSNHSDKAEDSFNSMINKLKDLPSTIINTELKETPGKKNSLKTIFKEIAHSKSYFNLLDNSFKLISQYVTNPKTYRNARNFSLEDLKLTHDYSKSKNPISDISDKTQQSELKKTFKEFAESNLKNYFGDKTPSRFDTFTNHYILLDFLGYYKDSHFKNLLQDSFHAYYGAHCDFFITDDENTYNKTKVIYDHFNIETIVCKSHEFNSRFFEKVTLNNKDEKPLKEIIAEVLNSAFVIKNQHDNEFNTVDIYKMDYYALDYFNRLQVTYNIDNTKSLYLYKKAINYSSFYFLIEIENIANKLFDEFGIDLNGRMRYRPEIENLELQEKRWGGRSWLFNTIEVQLKIRDDMFGLTLLLNV